MTLDPTLTRRGLLAAGAGTAGLAALAACSSSSSGSAASGAGGSASGASAGKPAAAASSGDASDSGSGGSTAAALATLSDVPVGGAVSVRLPDGKPGVVSRPTASTAKCFSAICTHQGCTVKPEGRTLNCPCHGSVFDAATGAVKSGPAPSPLPSVAVQVVGGKVVAA